MTAATSKTPQPDKYSAVWVSHSSISDFLECPRAYFLKNVYKDPNSNQKIQIMSPALALGQAVHEVLESLSILPTESRFATPLVERFQQVWKRVSGKQGGFFTAEQEQRFMNTGEELLRKVQANPGPLKNKAVKIAESLPHYWLSPEDGIILCGKIDWLEYLPETDSVHILDFKTSKAEEREDSLQLPIYLLLATHCQTRTVAKASYWYLRLNDEPVEKTLPDHDTAHNTVLAIAKKIKTQRKLNHFTCPNGPEGCRACKPFEAVLRGEGELIGTNSYRQLLYVLPPKSLDTESYIL